MEENTDPSLDSESYETREPFYYPTSTALKILRAAIFQSSGVGYRNENPPSAALIVLAKHVFGIDFAKSLVRDKKSIVKALGVIHIPEHVAEWLLRVSEENAPIYGIDPVQRRSILLALIDKQLAQEVIE